MGPEGLDLTWLPKGSPTPPRPGEAGPGNRPEPGELQDERGEDFRQFLLGVWIHDVCLLEVRFSMLKL